MPALYNAFSRSRESRIIGVPLYVLSTATSNVKGRFKAKKNVVYDVPPVVLERRVRLYDKEDNVALVKTELGNIRLAVSSPLETYLAQACIFRLAGDLWPGNTLEEAEWQEMAPARRYLGATSMRQMLPAI